MHQATSYVQCHPAPGVGALPVKANLAEPCASAPSVTRIHYRLVFVDTTPISDDYMGEMLAQTKAYTVLFLKSTVRQRTPEVDAIIWEHGRRNFALRAQGVLSIVCPVVDDSQWSGIGIFNVGADEVTRIMDDDPGVKAGVFTYEVHPVRSFPGDALPA